MRVFGKLSTSFILLIIAFLTSCCQSSKDEDMSSHFAAREKRQKPWRTIVKDSERVKTGMTKSDVDKILGKPSLWSRVNNEIRYIYLEKPGYFGKIQCLTITFRKAKVAETHMGDIYLDTH